MPLFGTYSGIPGSAVSGLTMSTFSWTAIFQYWPSYDHTRETAVHPHINQNKVRFRISNIHIRTCADLTRVPESCKHLSHDKYSYHSLQLMPWLTAVVQVCLEHLSQASTRHFLAFSALEEGCHQTTMLKSQKQNARQVKSVKWSVHFLGWDLGFSMWRHDASTTSAPLWLIQSMLINMLTRIFP